MTHSPLTNIIRTTTQSSSRQGARVDTFLIHHAATVSATGESIVDLMVSRRREVSSNYVIGSDGTVWCVVDENLRAWTSGSSTDGGKGAAWDRRAITVEIANESGAPDWRISEAALTAAARLLNDLRSRYTITNVLGHRDLWTNYRASYATYCPGPNTVAAIVSRADALLDPAAQAAAQAAAEAAKARVRTIAAYLNGLGLASFHSAAAQDGIPLDPGATYSRYWELVQRWGRKYRPDVYTAVNSVDGIVGPTTRKVEAIIWEALSAGNAPGASAPAAPAPAPTPAPAPSPSPAGGYTFTMIRGDGLTYQEVTGSFAARLQRGLIPFGYDTRRNSIDGIPGINTRKAVQRAARKGGYTGPIDGKLGKNTFKGVQRFARAGGYTGPIDGIPGINTWTGFLKALGV